MSKRLNLNLQQEDHKQKEDGAFIAKYYHDVEYGKLVYDCVSIGRILKLECQGLDFDCCNGVPSFILYRVHSESHEAGTGQPYLAPKVHPSHFITHNHFDAVVIWNYLSDHYVLDPTHVEKINKALDLKSGEL